MHDEELSEIRAELRLFRVFVLFLVLSLPVLLGYAIWITTTPTGGTGSAPPPPASGSATPSTLVPLLVLVAIGIAEWTLAIATRRPILAHFRKQIMTADHPALFAIGAYQQRSMAILALIVGWGTFGSVFLITTGALFFAASNVLALVLAAINFPTARGYRRFKRELLGTNPSIRADRSD